MFVANVVGPFLVEQMQPRRPEDDPAPASKWNDIYGFDYRLTEAVPVTIFLAMYTSWGNHGNSLINVTTTTGHGSGWAFEHARHRQRAPDALHTCYAAATSRHHSHAAAAEFIFATSPADGEVSCSRSVTGFCELVISTLHSWNTSYIGNMSCNLHKLPSEETHSPLAEVFIHGNIDSEGYPLKSTSPSSTVIYRNISDKEHYRLRCRRLDDRYACIDSLIIKAQFKV